MKKNFKVTYIQTLLIALDTNTKTSHIYSLLSSPYLVAMIFLKQSLGIPPYDCLTVVRCINLTCS